MIQMEMVNVSDSLLIGMIILCLDISILFEEFTFCDINNISVLYVVSFLFS